jgi:hypothetical protein
MWAIGDEHAIPAVQTFFIQCQLGEKKNRWHDVNIRALTAREKKKTASGQQRQTQSYLYTLDLPAL